jgi:hypothetical protein
VPPNKRSNWIAQVKVEDPDSPGTWVDLGRWAVLEGGGVSSEENVYHDWDGPQQLGGVKTREAATLRRLYGRNAQEVYSQLDGWVGMARVEMSRVATDDRGVAVGEVVRYTGRLGGAKLPDVEKGSSEGGEIELTLHLDAALA